jgi:single-stranded-DNA-specific exonuclease
MSDRLFLNVSQSLRGRRWRDRLGPAEVNTATTLVQRHELPDLLARVLAGRGVTADTALDFLSPTLKSAMPDPSTLTDMDAAAARLGRAVERGERVAIFGDYDVDGATSAAILARFLSRAGLVPQVYIPDRIFEGYGPNIPAIRALADEGATLLVTVDCGTTSHEALAEAGRLGLDTVVIDHHQADERLPAVAALVNPNRLDDVSGQGHLAACGLVFLVIVAVNRWLRERGFWAGAGGEPDLTRLIDLVALGTVADVVALKGLNRAYVARGLQVMRARENAGLRALMDVARLDGPPEPWHLGFLLGPRINAGGRIGEADMGARLLLSDDPAEASGLAAALDRMNRERQVVEQETTVQAEAEAHAALGIEEKGAVVVTAARGWHPGVMGLVAARLKERFQRPAFAVALNVEGDGTGSGRSIPGVDLGRAVRAAVAEGLLVKGGGHPMAAGITVARDHIGAFRAFMEERLAADVAAARAADRLSIDGAATAGAMHPGFVSMLAKAGPFGAGNPEPVLALPSHTIAWADVVGAAHVKLRLKADDGAVVDAIAFRAAAQPFGQALLKARGQPLHVAGTPVIDRYQGNERVQVRVIDAAVPTLPT